MKISTHQLRRLIREAIELDLEVGDVILTGKFKNKRTVVKKIGTDDLGQPTINGIKALAFRIEKLMPQDKWSKVSKEELENEKLVEQITSRIQAKSLFGDYLFGDDRHLPAEDPEWNTAPEDALGRRLYKWFHGRVKAFARRDIMTMQQLRGLGMYLDVLEPPSGTAWRYTPLPWTRVESMLASVSPVDKIDVGDGKTMSVFEIGHKRLPIHLDKPIGRERYRHTRSWTITPTMFGKLARDWGGLAHSLEPEYPVVFFQADIDANRDSFLLNPAETRSFAAEFAYQNEVLQTGPLTLSGGFVYRPDKPIGQAFTRKKWDQAILSDILARV